MMQPTAAPCSACILNASGATLNTQYKPRCCLSDVCPQDRVRILAEVSAGLSAMHTHQPPIIHLDVKPSNILLRTNGQAVLGDPGLAWVAHNVAEQALGEQSSASLSVVRGTHGFVDPELHHSGRASTKSDVYSLGGWTVGVAMTTKRWGNQQTH